MFRETHMAEKLKVFLCHASENKPVVQELFERLKADGFDPWLDSERLLPGMGLDIEIQKAMRASDAVIVCLSAISVDKEGYVQKEIKYAREIQKEKPDDTIFLLPIQIEKCDIPFSLQEIHWGKYYLSEGYDKIIQSLKVRANQLGRIVAKEFIHALPIGSYLPFPRNVFFTGREKDLESLKSALTGTSGASTVISQTISGMGGIGKTQLAVEFAYQFGYLFKGIHWLDLRDTTVLDSQIASCGEKMDFRYWPKEQPEQVSLTLRTWQTEGPRLLILDNFENIQEAQFILARFQNQNLRLLITSRHSDWPSTLGLQPLPLDVFTDEESKIFLKKYTKDRFTDEELKKLAARLGELPLALELAGRYLDLHSRLSIDDYLSRITEALEHPSMRGFRRDLPNPTGHELDLLATFALSWQQVQHDVAKNIFMIAGYCVPNTTIPYEIFENSLSIDKVICDEEITYLTGLGLIKENISLHPLLAEYARHLDQDRTKLSSLTQSLVEIVKTRSIEADKAGNYSLFAPLVPHLQLVADKAEANQIPGAAYLWNDLGYHVQKLADYTGAKAAYERALKIDEAVLGLDHPDVARDVNNLGSVLLDLGDIQGAKAAHERALKIRETVLGPDHPDVALDVGNLGNVLRGLGDLQGAKAAFERALKIREAALGPRHLNVAIDVGNLGNILHDLGDLQGAKTALERALKIREAALGPNHPDVAIDVGNLGNILHDLGDLQGAKTALERALKIHEAALGPVHPDVAIDVGNLGNVLRDLGDLQGAKTAHERALKIHEAALGPDHPNVAIDVNNLGNILRDLGDFQGAKAASERALKIDEAVLGPDHLNVAGDVNNLGNILRDLGDLQGAKAAHERALKIHEAALGPDHPNVAIDVNNLGNILHGLGDLQGAKAAHERALKIHEAALGPDHPDVARDVNNLGGVLRDLGDLQGAKAAFERALPTFQKTYGSTYETGELLNNLGLTTIELGNTSGINYLRQAKLIIQKTLPHNHPLRKQVEQNIQMANIMIKNPQQFGGKKKRY
jgi:tetratricopeptide (TPR) repeat protein